MADDATPGTYLNPTRAYFLQVVEYSCLASTVLLSYDWFLTIKKEIQLIWLGKWGKISILFFLVRYSSLATWGFQMAFSLNTFPGNVVPMVIIVFIFANLAWVSMSCVFTLRTYALYGKNRWILICFTPLIVGRLIINSIASFVDVCHIMPSISQSRQLTPEMYHCLFIWSTVSYALSVLFDTLVFVLTIRRSIRTVREAKAADFHSILTVFIRDGSLYYGCIVLLTISPIAFQLSDAHVSQQLQYFTLCLGIMHPTSLFQCQPVPPIDTEPINMINAAFSKEPLERVPIMLQNSLAAILVNRLILNLRRKSDSARLIDDQEVSNIAFAGRSVIDTLGKPIKFHEDDEEDDEEDTCFDFASADSTTNVSTDSSTVDYEAPHLERRLQVHTSIVTV